MLLALILACGSPAPVDVPPEGVAVEAVEEVAAEAEVEKVHAVPAARVNLNSATEEQLAALPGMTPKMVHEFEEYRPYVSIAQFRKEIGKYVPAEQVALWEPYVYVPIAPNDCDAATLAQLPGVDAAAAEALIAGRPYADTAAFTAALTERVGEEDAAKGAALLQ